MARLAGLVWLRSLAHASDEAAPIAAGEQPGSRYLDTALRPGVLVVTEGRGPLSDGDAVTAKAAGE